MFETGGKDLRNFINYVLNFIDRLSDLTGKVFAWLVVVLVLALVYEVAARYLFDAPRVWAWDMTYMLYGTHFMMGAAYLLLHRGNVRIDIFYERFSPRRKAIVDLCLYPILLFPVLILLVIEGVDRAWFSWEMREVAMWTAWKPPIYPLRAVLPIGVFLLLLQAIAEFIRNLTIVIKRS